METEFLNRWVEKIYPSKESLLKALETQTGLLIYHGIDPTAPHLHLGHTTNLFLLEKLRQLGCRVVLLIGDFTAQIGDPTGKDTTRKPLTRQQVEENSKTYQQQAAKILNFKSKDNPAALMFNSQWLDRLSARDIVGLTAKLTHSDIIKREMFQKRLKEGKEIYIHEFLYPVFQGYDSVAMDVDGEVGGNDQTFNMLVGRDLVKTYKNKEKFVITTPLLINPKTGRKLMSKTETYIALDLPANEMYGAVMSLPDEVVGDCFKLCTKVNLNEVKNLAPLAAKARLASEITTIYHSQKAAQDAQKEFNRIFKERKLPSKIPAISVPEKNINILDLLVKTKLASSKSSAKRLVGQGGVEIDGKTKKDWKETIEVKKDQIIKVGPRKFVKINA